MISDTEYRIKIDLALTSLAVRLDLTLQDMLKLAYTYGNKSTIER